MNRRHFLNHFRNGLAILISLAITAFLSGAIVSAAGTANVVVSVPAEPVGHGEQFQIDIDVVPNNDIAGMQFSLTFDPTLVTANSISEGSLLSQDDASTFFYPGNINNVTGTITAVYGAIIDPGESVSTAGTFATITFTAATQGGSCPLSLLNVVVGDMGGNPVPTTINDGIVDINSSPELDPIGNKVIDEGDTLTFTISAYDADADDLTYGATNLPDGAVFDPVTRTLSWTPGYRQAGTYTSIHFVVSDGSLTDTEDINITVNNILFSDVNEDGAVNVLDLVAIGQHWNETGPNGWIIEDVNEDGTVNVLDIIPVGQAWTG